MSRLQIQMFSPYLSTFSDYSYGYEPSNELKSVHKHPDSRFGQRRFGFIDFTLLLALGNLHKRGDRTIQRFGDGAK